MQAKTFFMSPRLGKTYSNLLGSLGFQLLLLCTFVSTNRVLAQHTEIGIASYYNDSLEGKPTASGEIYSHSKLTAAHRTIPFQSKIKVTNLINERSVIVTVNDRGPFVKGRILDLSKSAAEILGFVEKGVTRIKLEVVEPKKMK